MTNTACAQPFTCCFFFFFLGGGEEVKKKNTFIQILIFCDIFEDT